MEESSNQNKKQLTGWQKGVDVAYGYLMQLFIVSVLAEMFLFGYTSYSNLYSIGNGSGPYDILLVIMGCWVLVMFIMSLLTRVSAKIILMTLLLAVLVVVLSHVLSHFSQSISWVGGLHRLNSVATLVLSSWLARHAVMRGSGKSLHGVIHAR